MQARWVRASALPLVGLLSILMLGLASAHPGHAGASARPASGPAIAAVPALVNQDRSQLSVAGEARRPSVAIAIDEAAQLATIHVVWQQASLHLPGHYDLVHRFRPYDLRDASWVTSDWSVPKIFQTPGEAVSLTASGGRVFVAFEKPVAYVGDKPTIRLRRWDTEGLEWSQELTVTPDNVIDEAEEGNQPTLAVDVAQPNRLWLAWIDNRNNTRTAYAARLGLDGTVELSGPIDSGFDDVQSPSIDADHEDQGSVWAAWSTHVAFGDRTEGRVWRAEHQRDENSLTWRQPKWLNKQKQGSGPRLVVSADDVCVAWQERIGEVPGLPDILLDCASSQKIHNFSDSAGVLSSAPGLAFGEGIGAMLAWREGSPPTDAIDFRLGPPPSEDTHQVDQGSVRSPALAFDGSSVHAVYVLGSGAEARIFYTRLEGVTAPATPTNAPTAPSATATSRASATATVKVPASATPTASATATKGTPTRTPTTEPTTGPGTPSVTPTPTEDRPRHTIFIPYTRRPPLPSDPTPTPR